jgi:hypothetical protein
VNRVDHRLLGGAWGLWYGTTMHALTGAQVPVVLGCGAVAALTAGGRLSPDVDQYWRTRTVRCRSWGQRILFGPTREVRPWWPIRGLRRCWLGFAWVVTRQMPWQPEPGPWRRGAGRHGDPTQHRGITHNWLAPALAELVLLAAMAVGWAAGWDVPWWPFWAALVGWWSHLAGDLVHGRQVWGQDGHGVPLSPWWGHAGVGLKSAGWTAHVVAWGVAVPVSVLLMKVAAGI